MPGVALEIAVVLLICEDLAVAAQPTRHQVGGRL
jgi:hypothetical protein